MCDEVHEEFQFHKGTIKTRCGISTAKTKGYFNSIKVQLKRYDEIKRMRGDLNFNSIKVQLKQGTLVD